MKLNSAINLFEASVPFLPPENMKKPLVFWCFQGVQKETVASDLLKDIIYDKGVFSWMKTSCQIIIFVT